MQEYVAVRANVMIHDDETIEDVIRGESSTLNCEGFQTLNYDAFGRPEVIFVVACGDLPKLRARLDLPGVNVVHTEVSL